MNLLDSGQNIVITSLFKKCLLYLSMITNDGAEKCPLMKVQFST